MLLPSVSEPDTDRLCLLTNGSFSPFHCLCHLRHWRSRLGMSPELPNIVFGPWISNGGRGGLMVRVGANAQDAALREPHVRPIEMAGRTMTGFVRIAPEGYHTAAALKAWLDRALDFVTTLPAKRSSGVGILGPTTRP
jgi:hypothetical protein